MNPWRQQRAQMLAGGAPQRGSRMRAEMTSDAAHLYLYDLIDPWGGYWGISAAEVVAALQGVNGGVTVHLNSPGGDVFEAIAIHSALRTFAGAVTIRVDGVAASAASFLMTAGNRVEVAPNAQVMIHDAWSVIVGNEAEAVEQASLLGRTSQNLANAYAARAGGTPEEWRARMRPSDTWFIGAQEIIDSGLADAVIPEGTDLGGVEQEAEAFAAAARSLYSPAAAVVPDEDSRLAVVPAGGPVAVAPRSEPATGPTNASINPETWAAFRAATGRKTA